MLPKEAKRDIDTSNYLYKGKRFKEASFYAQQSAEKALKAVYIKEKNELIRIHDLVVLAKKINLPEEFMQGCEVLTSVYTDSRYPDTGEKEYLQKETEEDIKTTQNILKWVERKL